jgi:apolipoprotein N-acyltransferase
MTVGGSFRVRKPYIRGAIATVSALEHCMRDKRLRAAPARDRTRRPSVLVDVAVGAGLVLGSLLLVVGMGSPSYRWTAWLALVPLLSAIRVFTPLGALAAGAFWGLSWWSLASVVGLPVAGGAWGAALLAAAPGAYCLFGAYLTRRIGFSPFVLGVAWTGVELSLSPLAMPSGLVGLPGADSGLLHWVAHTFGYVIVGSATAYVSALAVDVVDRLGKRAPGPVLTGRTTQVARRFPEQRELAPISTAIAIRPRGPPRCMLAAHAP